MSIPKSSPSALPTCAYKNCTGAVRSRGLCPTHYTSWYNGKLKDYPPYKSVRTQYRVPDKQTDLAYIAGLIDGEGHIKRNTGRWQILIGMNDEEVIDFLYSFGGTRYKKKAEPPRQESHVWALSRMRHVLPFLKAVLPHMKLNVKRKIARHAIQELEVHLATSSRHRVRD